MGFGATELVIILVIVLVVFGAGKLSRTMGELGKGVKSFKDGMKEGEAEVEAEKAKPAVKKAPAKKAPAKKTATKTTKKSDA